MGTDSYNRIVFTGDIMCSKVQNEQILAHNNDTYSYETLFCHIDKYFKEAYVCGNLETPVSEGETTQEFANFNTPNQFIKALKESGFSFLSTANNHALDRGKTGLIQTVENINKFSIDHAGTYLNQEESEQILVKEIQGCKISILSFTYGLNTEVHNNYLESKDEYMVDLLNRQIHHQPIQQTNKLKHFIKQISPDFIHRLYLHLRGVSDIYAGQLDNIPDKEIHFPENEKYVERCLTKVQKAKTISDIVVVCCHVGGQYNSSIGGFTDYITKRIVDAGADYVIGNHPHCILNYKKINSSYVFYSIGNFSFTPNYGFYVDDVCSECSIILTLYPAPNKTIEHITYSVAIVRTDEDNISRTYLLYDLIVGTYNIEERNKLLSLHNKAIQRFTNNLPESLQKEYTLF